MTVLYFLSFCFSFFLSFPSSLLLFLLRRAVLPSRLGQLDDRATGRGRGGGGSGGGGGDDGGGAKAKRGLHVALRAAVAPSAEV